MSSGWRLIEPAAPVRDGASNMAVDHALLETVQAGGRPALRLYRWGPPCLSFGRNQPARGLYDAESAAARGIGLVRRPTGGQAVYHDRELTYAVAVPVGALGSPRDSYRAINRALVAGLARVGVGAAVWDAASRVPPPTSRSAGSRDESIAARDPAAPDWLAPCFRTPAPGEVTAAGRKLVGSAQRCEDRVILQHGSILLDGDQAPARDLLSSRGDAGPADSPATLRGLLGAVPPLEHLIAAVVAGFERSLGLGLVPEPLSAAEAARARELAAHYRSEAWTWRR